MRYCGLSGFQSLKLPARKIFFLPPPSGLNMNTTPSAVRLGPAAIGAFAAGAGAAASGVAGAAGAGSAAGVGGAVDVGPAVVAPPPQVATAIARNGASRQDLEVMRVSG